MKCALLGACLVAGGVLADYTPKIKGFEIEQNGQINGYGIGMSACKDYLYYEKTGEHYKTEKLYGYIMLSFYHGYLTANIKDFADKAQNINGLLADFCEKHPDKTLYNAATTIAERLKK